MMRRISAICCLSSVLLTSASIGASAHGSHGDAMRLAMDAEAVHRFELAEHHLRDILAEQPKDAQAWLRLASLETVRGDMDDARVACAEAARHLEPLVAIACRGRLALAGAADLDRALSTLLAMLQHPSVQTRRDELVLWAWGVAAELAVAIDDSSLAERLFTRALAGAPAVHLQAAYLDFLLANERESQVLDYVDTDDRELARRLRRVIALTRIEAKEGGNTPVETTPMALELATQTHALHELFLHWIEVEDFTHGREMAMFYLQVQPNSELALLVATENLRHQREVEDRRLYREAIVFARS